jgi:hypothetical protein
MGKTTERKIRLLKHTAAPAVPDSGSYEVQYPDGRESVYFVGTTTPAADPSQWH